MEYTINNKNRLTIPALDMDGDSFRQVVVDKEEGFGQIF